MSANLKDARGITLVNKACSDFQGTHQLFSPEELSGMASFAERDLRHLDITFSSKEIIEVTTIDAFCRENQSLSPSIVKIDVEGFEMSVLKGAISTLENSIELVQFEFGGTDIDSRTFLHDFWIFFEDKPFDLFRLTPRGFKKVSCYAESFEHFTFTTYVAVRVKP